MALYSQDFLERVRSANELSQVVGSYNVQLKRAGSNLLGLCPFHNEKTPSFNIRPAEQFFRCFGCGAKGDVFRFVQMMERIEFPEAVKILAERAGLQLEFESPAAARQAVKQSETKSALLWCTSRALDYYEENLYKPNGAAALEYLLNRGFTRETITRWRLGWAPDSWDGLCGFLLKNAKDSQQKEKVMEYARQAGVVRAKEMERGSVRYYDAFRGRVMFPITDIQARPIAFGGRLLEEKPDAGGKYINSSEGRLFEKRKVLFGLSQAAKEIALTGKAVVVEGYTDVVMCHQYGIKNVVATLGTSLTEDHIALLRRHVSAKGGVVAFFDSDAAGEKATRRAIGLFMAEDVPLLVAGGLEPKDAADYLPVHGSERFSRHIEMAEDGFIHVLNRTIGAAKGRDVGALGNAVREVMELVNTCPDAVKRAIMRHRVAAEAGVPEETLPKPAEKAAAFPGRVAARPEARPSVKRGLSHSPAVMGFDAALHQGADGKRKREMRLLRYMCENPDWCHRVADKYPPDEWRDHALSVLAEAVRDEWNSDKRPSVIELRARVGDDPEVADRLADLAFPDLDLSESDLDALLLQFRNMNREDELKLLLSEMEKAERSGNEELADRLASEYVRLNALAKKG